MRERKEGVPSYDACVQGHTKGREEKVPSYDKRIQGHPRREEGEREGKKERERERKGEERKKKKAGVPSYEQASRDTPKKERGDPECCIQENPRKQRKKGGRGGGEKGLSSRQVPMNLEQTSVAATTYGLPEGCHL